MALSKHEGAVFLLCVILCIEKDAELEGDVSKLWYSINILCW